MIAERIILALVLATPFFYQPPINILPCPRVFSPMGVPNRTGHDTCFNLIHAQQTTSKKENKNGKKNQSARMVAAKKRAATRHGGKGMVKNRTIGKHIMKT